MLRVNVQKLGKITILQLLGQIVTGEMNVLRKAVISQSDVNVVVLDFACVTVVDGRGLSLMLELREWLLSNGIELSLIHVTRLVRQVFEITCLNTVFKFSSEAEILAKVSSLQPAAVDAAGRKEVGAFLGSLC